MKKIVVVVFALLLAFTVASTALAEEFVPPIVKPGTGNCGGEIAEFPGGFAAFGCGEFTDVGFKFLYTRDPAGTFGSLEEFPSSGASYSVGSVNIYALENAKRVKEFPGLVEICFWDPGMGTVRFWTGAGWQVMPTYVYEGFRCTVTKVPGWFTITSLSLEQ